MAHERRRRAARSCRRRSRRYLSQRGATLVTAESCTGGWIAKTLTDIAGSSSWFECGVVAYSYEAKESLLGVRPRDAGAPRRRQPRDGHRNGFRRARALRRDRRRRGHRHRRSVRRHAGQTGRHRVDRLEAAWRLRAAPSCSISTAIAKRCAGRPSLRRCDGVQTNSYKLTRDFLMRRFAADRDMALWSIELQRGRAECRRERLVGVR